MAHIGPFERVAVFCKAPFGFPCEFGGWKFVALEMYQSLHEFGGDFQWFGEVSLLPPLYYPPPARFLLN